MHSDRSDLDQLRALNARFIHNFVTNDVPSHDANTHPRFVYVLGSGARVGRSAYLRDWATGFDAAVLPYWDMRDEHIDVFGDFALVRATSKYVLRSAGHGGAAMRRTVDRARGQQIIDLKMDLPPRIGKERAQRVRGRPEVLAQQEYDLGEVGSGEGI